MASHMLFFALFVLFLSSFYVDATTFVLTTRQGVFEGDIDELDQVQSKMVKQRLSTPHIKFWATRQLKRLEHIHPELGSVDVNKLTSPTECLAYLEDLIQESGLDVREFVSEMFDQAGMQLEVYD